MKRLPILLILFLPLLAACGSAAAPPAAPTLLRAQTAHAQGAAPVDFIIEGTLEPVTRARIAFQADGVVAGLLVAEGQAVQAGDVLIRLDDRDAALQMQAAQARLATAESGLAAALTRQRIAAAEIDTAEGQVLVAEARLDLVRAGPLPEEIAAAEANVAAAEARVAAAVGSRDATLTIGTDAAIRAAEADLASATANRQAVADRYDEILNNCTTQPDGSVVCPEYGPVEERTRAELEAARASEAAAQALLNQLRAGPTAAQRAAANGIVTVASANLAVAEAQLALVEAGPTAAAVSRVEVELAQAEARVAQAAAGAQAAEAAVSQAEAELAAAQVAVDRAQLALDTTMLTAPFAGVVSVIDVNPGELVALGNPILTLADLSTWQIRAPEVVDLDVARLAVGRPLEITLDALPGETLAGTVSAIALTPRLADGNTVYEVLIALDDVPDLPLRWGMTAVIRVTAPEG